MIPAERRVPDKDETWTLATEQAEHDSNNSSLQAQSETFLDVSTRSKGEITGDSQPETLPTTAGITTSDSRDSSLPRGHETRKSKTRRVKSYLRKCKGALTTSKTEDSSSVERRERQSNCTSWYVDEAAQSEDHEDDIDEASSRTIAKVSEDTGEKIVPVCHENNSEFNICNRKDSGFSIYEDASDLIEHHRSSSRDRVGSRETLVLIDDSSLLNKCDSSDTLIGPELPEISGILGAQLDTSVSSVEDDEKIRGPSIALPTVSFSCNSHRVLLLSKLKKRQYLNLKKNYFIYNYNFFHTLLTMF